MKYEVEYLDVEALQKIQLERLQKNVAHAYANVPHYQKTLGEFSEKQ